VIFETVAIDMGLESDEGILSHKTKQIERIMENITPAHHPELIESLKELQGRSEHCLTNSM